MPLFCTAPAHEIKILQDTDRVVSAPVRASGRLMQRISCTPGIYQEEMVWGLFEAEREVHTHTSLSIETQFVSL